MALRDRLLGTCDSNLTSAVGVMIWAGRGTEVDARWRLEENAVGIVIDLKLKANPLTGMSPWRDEANRHLEEQVDAVLVDGQIHGGSL